MIMQKKYFMILLLGMSSFSYGMDKYFADETWTQDPLDPTLVYRHVVIQKTTREMNAASEVASGSNGYYKVVKVRGIIAFVVPVSVVPKKPVEAKL